MATLRTFYIVKKSPAEIRIRYINVDLLTATGINVFIDPINIGM
jgi:hypothetical protein